jgi:hypothetical protein
MGLQFLISGDPEGLRPKDTTRRVNASAASTKPTSRRAGTRPRQHNQRQGRKAYVFKVKSQKCAKARQAHLKPFQTTCHHNYCGKVAETYAMPILR